MDNEMKAKVRNAALAEAVAAVPGGALCDPQQVADAIRALMTEPLTDDVPESRHLLAEALAVFDLMLTGCREQAFGDYENGDGETIGPRMDALHKRLREAVKSGAAAAPAADVRDAAQESDAEWAARHLMPFNGRTTSAAPAAQFVVWLKQASSFGPWTECAPEDEGAVRFTAPADAEKGGA